MATLDKAAILGRLFGMSVSKARSSRLTRTAPPAAVPRKPKTSAVVAAPWWRSPVALDDTPHYIALRDLIAHRIEAGELPRGELGVGAQRAGRQGVHPVLAPQHVEQRAVEAALEVADVERVVLFSCLFCLFWGA